MKSKLLFLTSVLLAALAPAVSHASELHALWTPQIASPQMPSSFAVHGGSAPIEQALATIIPSPYKIELDARVPSSLVMTWESSSDWMTALKAACTPLGLSVTPDWSANTIMIAMKEGGMGPSALANPTKSTPPVVRKAPPALPPAVPMASPATSTVSDSTITGKLGPSWAQRIPSGSQVGLSAAVLRIEPVSKDSTSLEIIGLNDAKRVSWQAGSRESALRTVLAQAGALASVSQSGIRIAPRLDEAADSTTPEGGASTQPPAVSAPKPTPFALKAGESLETQLQGWAAKAGWTVIWNLPNDWIVPGAATFTPDFETSANRVVEALSHNGADVRADVYTVNKTIVIHQAGGSN